MIPNDKLVEASTEAAAVCKQHYTDRAPADSDEAYDLGARDKVFQVLTKHLQPADTAPAAAPPPPEADPSSRDASKARAGDPASASKPHPAPPIAHPPAAASRPAIGVDSIDDKGTRRG